MGQQEDISDYFKTLHLRGEGRFDEAITTYRKILDKDPLNHITRWNLAVTLSQKGDYTEALQECRKLVEAQPENYTFLMTLVIILLEHKRWSEALPQAQRLAQLEPNLSSPHALIGDAYYGLGELASSIRFYEMATNLQAATPDMHATPAELYLRTGRTADAIGILQKLVARAPTCSKWRFELGKALGAAGRFAEARSQWSKVLGSAQQARTSDEPDPALDELVRLAQVYLAQYREQ